MAGGTKKERQAAAALAAAQQQERERLQARRDARFVKLSDLESPIEQAIVDKDVQEAEELLDLLDSQVDAIKRICDQITAIPANEADDLAEESWQYDFEDISIRMRRKVVRFIKAATDQAQEEKEKQKEQEREKKRKDNTTQGKTNMSAHLPEIKLKTFSGDIKEWLPWWGSFRVSVHENPAIKDKVVKFTYLIHFTSGAAAAAINGFPVIEEHYNEAIETIQNQFGRPGAIRAAYFASLNQLQSINDMTDVKGLRKLYDKVMSSVRCLRGMGVNDNSFSYVLMPMLLVRIPEDLSYRWHESDKHEDKDLKEFLDFLKKFIESREDADMLRKELKTKGESSAKQNHQKKEKEDSPKSTAAALAANAAGPSKEEESRGGKGGSSRSHIKPKPKARYPCVFCKEEHFPIQCTIPLDRKWDVVKKEKRCFICLRDNHVMADCKAKWKCSECTELHHTALHSTKKSASTPPSTSSGPKTVSKPTTPPGSSKTISAIVYRYYCYNFPVVFVYLYR